MKKQKCKNASSDSRKDSLRSNIDSESCFKKPFPVTRSRLKTTSSSSVSLNTSQFISNFNTAIKPLGVSNNNCKRKRKFAEYDCEGTYSSHKICSSKRKQKCDEKGKLSCDKNNWQLDTSTFMRIQCPRLNLRKYGYTTCDDRVSLTAIVKCEDINSDYHVPFDENQELNCASSIHKKIKEENVDEYAAENEAVEYKPSLMNMKILPIKQEDVPLPIIVKKETEWNETSLIFHEYQGQKQSSNESLPGSTLHGTDYEKKQVCFLCIFRHFLFFYIV